MTQRTVKNGTKATKWMVCGCLFLAIPAAVPALAQQASPADAYQGVSQPPSEAILASEQSAAPKAKPSAAKAVPQAATVAQTARPASAEPATDFPPPTDLAAANQAVPALSARPATPDPDGDIVHLPPARPGELTEGSVIQVRLLDRLSSAENEKGDHFKARVAQDVMQGRKVLIPVGAIIEGRVSAVSSGHFAGHGSLRLSPDTVTMPDGSRFSLRAETSGAPGTNTRINDEGAINPGPRKERDGIEYGALVGAGAATGAVFAGPVGALTGGLIGAGMVTTHIMVSHTQTTLEAGSMLQFTLTEPLDLMPSAARRK
uniref:TrbI/VirB10 family protein n=1 Tax=mine drainage metagenome TaxID=410659 RepID=E6QHS6_9ZZZZ